MIQYRLEKGVYSFWSVWLDDLLVAKLKKGVATKACFDEALSLTQGESDTKRLDSLFEKVAFSYSLKLLTRQSYHSSRLLAKLQEGGLPKEASVRALSSLQAKGYLDDQSFVRDRVKKWQRAGKSEKEIGYRLQGLHERLPGGVRDEKSALFNCLNKKYPTWQCLIQEPSTRRRLFSALLRRGFSSDTLFQVFREQYES